MKNWKKRKTEYKNNDQNDKTMLIENKTMMTNFGNCIKVVKFKSITPQSRLENMWNLKLTPNSPPTSVKTMADMCKRMMKLNATEDT